MMRVRLTPRWLAQRLAQRRFPGAAGSPRQTPHPCLNTLVIGHMIAGRQGDPILDQPLAGLFVLDPPTLWKLLRSILLWDQRQGLTAGFQPELKAKRPIPLEHFRPQTLSQRHKAILADTEDKGIAAGIGCWITVQPLKSISTNAGFIAITATSFS